MSSFRRKGALPVQIPLGCRLSTHNSETLVSSGVSALDDIIGGGGVPLHSTTLIKADRFTGYAQLLLKYFISQGLTSKQPVILVSLDESPADILKTLPVVVESSSATNNEPDDGGEVDGQVISGFTRVTGRVLGASRGNVEADKMRIAWRYNNLPKVASQIGAQPTNVSSNIPFCSIFDITKQKNIDEEMQSGAIQCLSDSNFDILYDSILSLLTVGGFLDAQHQSKHVARIVINQFASLKWQPENIKPMLIFMTKLKRLVQTSSAVLFITIPAYAFDDFNYLSSHPTVRLIEHISDCVIEVESFSGSPRELHSSYTNPPPSSPQYHGLIHLIKLPCLKSLVGAICRTLSPGQMRSLAFRVRRKRFAIEVFHLPPDEGIEDDTSAVGSELSKMVIERRNGSGCATGSSVDKLDF